MKDFNYVAPPTIARFMRSNALIRILVGPPASGKTVGCFAEILRRCSEAPVRADGKRRSRWAIISPSRRFSKDCVEYAWLEWMGEYGVYNTSQRKFTFRFSDVEADIFFLGMDTRADMLLLMSIELTGAFIPSMSVPPEVLHTLRYGRVGRFTRYDGTPQWSGIICEAYDRDLCNPHLASFIMNAEVFIQPSASSPEAENAENLPPGYYDRAKVGKSSDWIGAYLGEEKTTNNNKETYMKCVTDCTREKHNALLPRSQVHECRTKILAVVYRCNCCKAKVREVDGGFLHAEEPHSPE